MPIDSVALSLRAAEVERGDHRVMQAVRGRGAFGGGADIGKQQRELVAADAGEAVALADHPLDALGDADDQLVAGEMAVACR